MQDNSKESIEGVSVVLCCYNSTQYIEPTLRSLINQQVKTRTPWEVIIVDNNSSDNLSDYLSTFQNQGLNYKYLLEQSQGILFARLAGIRAAKYEYVLFCDDDNWLKPNYIQVAFEFISDPNNANIAAIGGTGKAVTDKGVDLPSWFNEHQRKFAVGPQAYNHGVLTLGKELWSAGMIFRRSLYLNIAESGVKHILVGRRKSEMSSGEDTEICLWFQLAGYDLYYNPMLKFKHHIRTERLSNDYLGQLTKGINSQNTVINAYREMVRYHVGMSGIQRFVQICTSIAYYFFPTKSVKMDIYTNYLSSVILRLTKSNQVVTNCMKIISERT